MAEARVACADCGVELARALADVVGYGTGHRCFACGVQRRIDEHLRGAARDEGAMAVKRIAEEERVATLRLVAARLGEALRDLRLAQLQSPVIVRATLARVDRLLERAAEALARDEDPDPWAETASDAAARDAAARVVELRRERDAILSR